MLEKHDVEKIAVLNQMIGSKVFIRCVTCGKIFLDVTVQEFIEKSAKYNGNMFPEYIEAAKHWIDTQHEIVGEMYGTNQSFSGFWSNMATAQNLSKTQVLQQLIQVEREVIK